MVEKEDTGDPIVKEDKGDTEERQVLELDLARWMKDEKDIITEKGTEHRGTRFTGGVGDDGDDSDNLISCRIMANQSSANDGRCKQYDVS